MASLSRLELINKFRKEIEDFWSGDKKTYHGIDTTHIQMASLDEMMSAYGYVPRRLGRHPEVIDGRFGYELSSPQKRDSRPRFMSFEDAIRMHNGTSSGFRTTSRNNRRTGKKVFARSNRIVENVSLQRNKKRGNDCSGIKAQTRWVKFLEESNGD